MTTDCDSAGDSDIRPGDGVENRSAGGGWHGDLKTLASGAGIGLVGRSGGRIVQFVSQVLLARSLAPAGYGLFSLAWTILRIGGFVAMAGLQNGVVRFGSELRIQRPDQVRSVIQRCLSLGLVTGTAVGLVVFLSADRLADSIFQMRDLTPALKIVSLSLPFLALARIAAAATRVSQRMVYSILADDFGQPVAFLCLMGILVFALDLGVNGALWALAGAFALSFGLGLLFLRSLFPPQRVPSSAVEAPRSRALLAYSLPTALAAMLSQFVLWTDRLFIGFYGSAGQVGVYEAIVQLTVPFLTVLSAFNAVFAPLIASSKTETMRIGSIFRICTKWGLYSVLPYFLTLLFAGRQVIDLVFGESYAPGFLPLLILSMGQLVNVGTGGVATLLIMTGHQHRWLQISASSLALNLILNWYLVPKLALVGAALATGIATSVLFITGVWVTRRTLGLWAYDRRYWKGVLSLLLTVLLLLVLRATVQPQLPPLAWVLVTVAAAGGLFLAGLWALGLDAEDREILDLVGLSTRSRGGAR